MLRTFRERRDPLPTPPGPGDSPDEKDRPSDLDTPENTILCRACGHVVTREESRISVSGAHRHSFFNPAGIVFVIGCFGDAPGLSFLGPSTPEFSWFPGYSWRLALCGSCSEHLGWLYTGPDKAPFCGLILDRLWSG
ncbi:MAG: cereblon family protein [Thermodesulfobacteriota bacterium]